MFVPGDKVPVVRADGANVVLVICKGCGSPEAVRETALKSAKLILVPAG